MSLSTDSGEEVLYLSLILESLTLMYPPTRPMTLGRFYGLKKKRRKIDMGKHARKLIDISLRLSTQLMEWREQRQKQLANA